MLPGWREGAAGGEAAAVSQNRSGLMYVLAGWPEDEAVGGSGKQRTSDPRLTCPPAMALIDQAAVVAGICRVGGTSYKQSPFVGFHHLVTLQPCVSGSLFFARGTGKGTREQSGPSDSPLSSPTDKSHRMLSVPPPPPLFLQASYNPWHLPLAEAWEDWEEVPPGFRLVISLFSTSHTPHSHILK